MTDERPRPGIALALLFAINTFNFVDRQLLSAVAEPLRREWLLSDLQIGWLGTSFLLLYAFVGIPLGRLSDTRPRRFVLAAALALWSLLTAASGLSRGFWSFFLMRLGVGAGEAACAPASTSLIGDYFQPKARARALSVFMLGLPVGISLAYLIGGTIAANLGWRLAYLVAGLPGVFLAGMTLFLHEPARGSAEPAYRGNAKLDGAPWKVVLRAPTMRWIILSGATHNFCLYAISFFLPTFLIRYHGMSLRHAGFLCAIVIGAIGGLGMLLGGWLGDRIGERRPGGRLQIAAVAASASVPLIWFAFRQPAGEVGTFLIFLGMGWMFLYAYYSNVYAAIQDILEPSLRGTGMSVYFFGMYILGAFWGPVSAGWASDWLSRRAAARAGAIIQGVSAVPDQFRSIGLHQALTFSAVPAALLAIVLFAACSTFRDDIERRR